MAELVIIGNGFDLACGLKSSYSDFFYHRYTDDRKRQLYDYEGISSSELCKLNFWDFIFGYVDIFQIYKEHYLQGTWQSDKTILDLKNDKILQNNMNFYESNSIFKSWQDIENVLKKYLILIDDSNIHKTVINNILSDKYIKTGNLEHLYSNEILELHLSLILLKIIRVKQTEKSIYKFDFIKEDGQEGFKRYLFKVLLSELKEFENSFKDYLLNQVNKDTEYSIKATRLMFNQILDSPNLEREKIKILNFNYTSPLGNGPISIRNVHGSLYDKGDIIFGIDNQKESSNERKSLRIFTKTYRMLGSIYELHKIYFGIDLEIKNDDITVINFYGHSLGEADYSYFQSIFDGVNLYSSNVALKFLYSDFDRKEKERQFTRISDLLSDYGETLDNKDHGKNLMHKLLLESRLIIKEI